MNYTIDYYQVLGVLEDAEDIVIRAAYRALAQKYHPDKWNGDKQFALERMKVINNAYNILSDIQKRADYDLTRDKKTYKDSKAEENYKNISEFDNNWNEICKYFPDLVNITNELRVYSVELENTYKIILIESKEFENRIDIKTKLINDYLKKYFGTNEEIIRFAEHLFLARKKSKLKELNKAINLLGTKVDSNVLISKIDPSYDVEEEILKNNSDDDALAHMRYFLLFVLLLVIFTYAFS